jgi:hypothetical protein
MTYELKGILELPAVKRLTSKIVIKSYSRSEDQKSGGSRTEYGILFLTSEGLVEETGWREYIHRADGFPFDHDKQERMVDLSEIEEVAENFSLTTEDLIELRKKLEKVS